MTTPTMPRRCRARPPRSGSAVPAGSPASPNTLRMLTTGSSRPRRSITPSTRSPAFGTRLTASGACTISCTRSIGSAYSWPSTVKLTSSSVSAVSSAAPGGSGTRSPRRDRCPRRPPPAGELRGDQAVEVQHHDHRRPSAGLDHADQHSERTVRLYRLGRLDRVPVDADHAGDAVDDEAERQAEVDDHRAGGVVVRGARQAAARAQAHDRQHPAAQVGQPFQAGRRERHPDQVRHADDLVDRVHREREQLARHVEGDEVGGVRGRRRPSAPVRCRRSPSTSGRHRGRVLAMSVLS